MGTLIWTDTFDTYTAGSPLPAPWVVGGNTPVSSAQSHSASNSVAVGAGGNNSNAYRPIGSNLSQWYVDFWMWVNNPSNLTGQYIAFSPVSSSGSGCASINVDQTGAERASLSNGATWFTFTVSINAWHHYLFEVTSSATGTAKLTVDGTVVGTYSGDTRDTGSNAYVAYVWLVGSLIGPSPTAEMFVDDLSVYSGTTAVAPPTGRAYMLSGSRGGLPSAALWQTTTRTFAVPLSAVVGEAAAPAPIVTSSAQARAMILA